MKNRDKSSIRSRGNSSNYIGKEWKMFEISFFGSRMSELLRMLESSLKQKNRKIWVSTLNPEFIMSMESDKKFADIIAKSDIKVIDGIGLIWAKEVLKTSKGFKRWWRAFVVGMEILGGKRREELISGVDLVSIFCKEAMRKKQRVFFLGGWGERSKKTAEYFKKRYQKLECDWCQGEPELRNEEVLKKINSFKTDYLIVAYGMKRQEEWIERNLPKLKVKIVMGVGRSFDYYSGELKRAPEWIRKMGLEWLYSLFREPKRWKRQLALPKFVWMVLTKVA